MITPVDLQMTNTQSKKRVRVTRFKTIGLIIWSILVIVQSLWFFEKQVQAATFLTLAGGIIGVIIFFKAKLLTTYPISTTMMLGYVSYYFLLPPLATFLEGKTLTNNLIHPTLDLFHASVCLLFLVLAFTIYRKVSGLQWIRWFISRKIYKPVGFFHPPSNVHLIFMGGIGLFAIWFQYFVAGGYQQVSVGTINKFIQGFFPLVYLPYAILVRKLIGKGDRFNRKWVLILIVYTILLGVVSLARNSRAALFSGVASIILAYLYGLAIGIYKLSKVALRNIALLSFVIILLSGPLTDLAISMVVVRGVRTDISAMELVSETIKTYQNKAALDYHRKNVAAIRSSIWDEWYVDNLFMSRLSNLKFADNSLDLALSMGKPTKNYLREIEVQKILAIFPQPIVNLFDLPVDKNFITTASSGDFMLYAVTGNPYALGGFRTGSIFGNGYVLFGWGYPFVFATLMLLLFPLADSLTSRRSIIKTDQHQNNFVPLLSSMVIVGLFSWFFFLTSAATGAESMSSLVTYLLRGWIQVPFMYELIYWFTYIPSKMISKIHI